MHISNRERTLTVTSNQWPLAKLTALISSSNSSSNMEMTIVTEATMITMRSPLSHPSSSSSTTEEALLMSIKRTTARIPIRTTTLSLRRWQSNLQPPA